MKNEFLCMDCGCVFTISINQIKRIKNQGMHLPTHCPMCRSYRWKEERLKAKRAKKFERKVQQ